MATPTRTRMAQSRARKSKAEAQTTQAMGGKVLTDSLRESVQMMKDAGLPMPSESDIAMESVPDRATTVARIIGAAGKAVELARKRGELITAEEHRERLSKMAGTLKRAIGQFAANLPGDLDPGSRKRCEEAMRKACVSAISDIERLSTL